MKRFKKTIDLLNELRLSNLKSEYGRPIPDLTWNEVIKELTNSNRKIEDLITIVRILILTIICVLLSN